MSTSFLGLKALRSRHTLRLGIALFAMLLLFQAPATITNSAHAASIVPQKTVSQDKTYSNPVIAQNTPDPAIIKALDGYYYVIATSDYWTNGTFHILPIYRSADLVHWTFLGDSFASAPDWVAPGAGLWAPDL